jgi:hypothetical protein
MPRSLLSVGVQASTVDVLEDLCLARTLFGAIRGLASRPATPLCVAPLQRLDKQLATRRSAFHHP